MSGLTRQQAIEAVAMGWDQKALNACHCFAMQQTAFPVTKILPWAIVFDGRYLAYRSTPIGALKRLRAQETPAAELVGCGNHGCRTRAPTGQATNGPCRCPRDEFTCYADGSGTTQEKPSGIGVVVYEPGGDVQLIAENIGPGTNNRAELAAIWRALKAVPDVTRRILIRSDSEYAAGVLTKDWALKSNIGLISAIRDDLAMRRGNVRIAYVEGHAGVEGNELADRLANMGRKVVSKVTAPW